MRVLVTGHTGFKGTWLSFLLQELGHEPVGYAKDDWSICKVDMKSHTGDVRDLRLLSWVIGQVKPDVILHLAAQPLVNRGWEEPHETFTTNICGTINVIEAATCPVVVVTSDKVYASGTECYCEDANLDGHDPYSASKVAAELVSRCYPGRKVVTARAGNCLGGGDEGEDRLVTNIVSGNVPLLVRLEQERPFQHVLDPLMGYVKLAEALVAGNAEGAYNFGPDESHTVGDFLREWGVTDFCAIEEPRRGEVSCLRIDSSKAKALGWSPVWDFAESVQRTKDWYDRLGSSDAETLIRGDIGEYLACDLYQQHVGLP